MNSPKGKGKWGGVKENNKASQAQTQSAEQPLSVRMAGGKMTLFSVTTGMGSHSDRTLGTALLFSFWGSFSSVLWPNRQGSVHNGSNGSGDRGSLITS